MRPHPPGRGEGKCTVFIVSSHGSHHVILTKETSWFWWGQSVVTALRRQRQGDCDKSTDMHACMQANYPFVQNNKLLKMKHRKTGSRPVWAMKQEPFLFGVNKLGKETRYSQAPCHPYHMPTLYNGGGRCGCLPWLHYRQLGLGT